MKKLYQLTLFYANLKDNNATIRNIRDDVETISNGRWRVLSAGEQVCAIGFETESEHEQLKKTFDRYGSAQLAFLLTEVNAVVSGNLVSSIWQWLAKHRPDSKS
ncbi:MAG TPA: hypothetical protein DCQ58_07840 [Saprospirales bacterium]|jgi:hypothetical protein|nr:hypothetical protein [Saprospirales bacterium]